MGTLVPFARPKRAKKIRHIPPPKDAVSRANWLHNILCCELETIVNGATRSARQSDYNDSRPLLSRFVRGYLN